MPARFDTLREISSIDSIEEITKMNDAHDPHTGRFAPKGGAGTAAPKYSKDFQKEAIDFYTFSSRFIREIQSGEPYTGNDADREMFTKYGEAIEEYIKDTPDYEGPIYRGVATMEPLDNIEEGKPLSTPWTNSWSKDSKIADEYSEFADSGEVAKYQYVFEAKKGLHQTADLENVGHHQDEVEVLLSKDAKPTITKVRQEGAKIYVEVEDSE